MHIHKHLIKCKGDAVDFLHVRFHVPGILLHELGHNYGLYHSNVQLPQGGVRADSIHLSLARLT